MPSQSLTLDDEMRIATYYVDNVDFTDERGATGDGSETLEIDQNVEGWVNGHPQWGNIDENDVEQILQLPEGEEERLVSSSYLAFQHNNHIFAKAQVTSRMVHKQTSSALVFLAFSHLFCCKC